jgi:DNA-binding NarL/FixJ family response regulator
MKQILLIDDHEVVRDGLKRIFSELGRTAEFGEASTPQRALQLAASKVWDIAVLDISLGELSGLDLLRELKLAQPRMRILVFSIHSEPEYVRRALKAGAAGYVTKDTPRAEIARAINTVLDGGRYLNPAIAEQLIFDRRSDGEKEPQETLSNRELEVMILLAKGHAVGDIAVLLRLSSKTISTYRARILDKMGMSSNADLTRYAVRSKLLD